MERRFYEYRGMRGGEHYERMEANPMIGYRGCFRNVAESDLFGIELAAITHVWESGLSNLHLMTVLLINGPNLAMLGRRDPAQYGTFTLKNVEAAFTAKAKALGVEARCFQSNHEGDLVEAIHGAMGTADGIVINAGAYTHTSYALLDALALTQLPAMEVHISDIHRREPFRAISVIQPACVGQVCGLGLDSYLVGLERLVKEQLRAAPGTAKPKAAAGGMDLLRISITEIDTQLVKLFNRRMELSEKVAAEKAVSALELQNCVFSACANRRFVLHSSLVGIMGGFKMGRFTSLNDRTAATRHGDADCRPRGILYPYSSGCTRTPWQSAGDTRAMATPPRLASLLI